MPRSTFRQLRPRSGRQGQGPPQPHFKAAVIGDTVGDPRRTLWPGWNIPEAQVIMSLVFATTSSAHGGSSAEYAHLLTTIQRTSSIHSFYANTFKQHSIQIPTNSFLMLSTQGLPSVFALWMSEMPLSKMRPMGVLLPDFTALRTLRLVQCHVFVETHDVPLNSRTYSRAARSRFYTSPSGTRRSLTAWAHLLRVLLRHAVTTRLAANFQSLLREGLCVLVAQQSRVSVKHSCYKFLASL